MFEWLRRDQRSMILFTAMMAIVLIGSIALASEEAAGGNEATKDVAETKAAGEEAAKSKETEEEDTYPLETCIVSGGKLGSMGDPVIYEYEGREIRFCCKGCIVQFEKDPKAYLEKMDKAIIARELPGYPLETCVVSGGRLGSMGDPVDYIYNNRLIRFCCAGCVSMFEKDPEKYMQKLYPADSGPADETRRHKNCGGH